MNKNLKELNQKEIGRRIRTIRDSKGLTREVLAEMVDVSSQFIADVEYGNKGMSIKTLFLMKQALGVTADYILTGNVYDADKDEEAKRTCDDIMSILHGCTRKQLRDLREISRLYADNVVRKKQE